MPYSLDAIAHVRSPRARPTDDFWGGQISEIVLSPDLDPSALEGLDAFSHCEVLFVFHEVSPEKIVTGARHPRNNPEWPKVGIFAQRGKNRPNRIGSTLCKIVGVEGRVLRVAELDAIDGTPVIDIKPVMAEFLPREPTHQPGWASELMRLYWAREQESSDASTPP